MLFRRNAGFSTEEDRLILDIARKIQRFLSQPFFVAEIFTGTPGVLVPLEETIRGFKEIVEGKHDDLPEAAFYMVGTIDEAIEKAKQMEIDLTPFILVNGMRSSYVADVEIGAPSQSELGG